MMPLTARAAWLARWLEPQTGPLGPLRGSKIICIADLENLHYSARDLGFRLNLVALTAILRGATHACVPHLHAFFSSAQPNDVSPSRDELEQLGWQVYVNRASKNADDLIKIMTPSLVGLSLYDLLLVLSGDGDLVQTLAYSVRHLVDTVTASLPLSTSRRLDARHNPLILANLEIGRDALTPLSREGVQNGLLIDPW